MAEEREEYSRVTCCHCGGLGCTYCDGTGKVYVRKPPEKCHHCGGDCCIYCGFTGWEGVKGKYD